MAGNLKSTSMGGVLGLPSDCDTLGELLEFTSDEFAIPTWYGDEYTRELEEARDAGNPVHASEQPWGVWGPHSVTHFLHKTGEAKYALPQEGLYPVTYKDRRNMLKRNFDMTPYITENTFSVHLYGRRMRARLVEKEGGAPHPKSLLGQLIKKHGIDPEAAPLPPSRAQKAAAEGRVEEKTPKVKVPKAAKSKPVMSAPKVAPIDQSERAGIGLVNLTDVADKFDVDKGSKRHRYTDMYQMLFSPLRTRKLNVMEMGLQDGGPEHNFPVDRKTTDAPSIRMWLEYFPKAEVYGLDVCDFSWLKEDRFTFVQCDMDTRENIAVAAKDLPKMDIIVDDASHASHHQQYAFLELFPQMASGGIYAIESLRWQPKHMETKGFTKTADLFYGYQQDGAFSHSDKEIEAELNGLRKHISGCFMYQVGYDKSRKDQFMVIQKR